jgi:hypothetical protein
MIIRINREFFFYPVPQAWQVYGMQILHPPGYPVTAAILRDKIKGTPCRTHCQIRINFYHDAQNALQIRVYCESIP